MSSLSVCEANTTYVALAEAILPADLQVHASAGGLCHVQVTGYTVAEQHLIHVTALPYRLHDATYTERVFPYRHVFCVFARSRCKADDLSQTFQRKGFPGRGYSI